MVVESFVTGSDYRVLVIGGRMVAIAERVPAHVIGDGKHTVGRAGRASRTRTPGAGSVTRRSSRGSRSTRPPSELVKKQGFGIDDVPPKGDMVKLADTGNMSTGGISIDRTWEAHEDNVEIAEEAARVVGLDVAGIDFLAPDIAQPVRETGGRHRRGERGARVPHAHAPDGGRAAVRGEARRGPAVPAGHARRGSRSSPSRARTGRRRRRG